MESKRLSFDAAKTVALPLGSHIIEVPCGTSHYHIRQSGQDSSSYTFNLREEGSKLTITGLVEATGTEAPELTTLVVHHTPKTKAETLVRTLVTDNAAPRYTGKIQIERDSRDCESYLNHHSLLLGDKAKSWTTPSLEIANNEVKCSHAATIRTITDTDLFYLRSRGLSRAESEELLITAFLDDVQS
jgi:Fe-S cluster assembly protein SufD